MYLEVEIVLSVVTVRRLNEKCIRLVKEVGNYAWRKELSALASPLWVLRPLTIVRLLSIVSRWVFQFYPPVKIAQSLSPRRSNVSTTSQRKTTKPLVFLRGPLDSERTFFNESLLSASLWISTVCSTSAGTSALSWNWKTPGFRKGAALNSDKFSLQYLRSEWNQNRVGGAKEILSYSRKVGR